MEKMEKPNLDNLPIVVLKNIFGECDFFGIITLRKVCRSIRSSIDQTHPESHIHELLIKMTSSESIQISIKVQKFRENTVIQYQKDPKGCLVTSQIKEKLIKKVDFLQIFLSDFEILLNFQSEVLAILKIEFHPEDVRFYENLEKMMKFRNSRLKVKSLELEIFDQFQILSILPYIDPESIDNIGFTNPTQNGNFLNLEEIVKLDQWKMAKEAEILWFTVTVSVEHFSNFSILRVEKFEEITAEDVIFMKKTFLNSNTSKFYHIGYKNFRDDPNLLESKLGKPDTCLDYDTQFLERRWYFEIANSENQVLLIEFCEGYMEFSRIDVEDVPDYVIVKK